MRPTNPYMRPAFCLSKSACRNFAVEASQTGKGTAIQHPRGLISLIALFAHFYLANHALVTASRWNERG